MYAYSQPPLVSTLLIRNKGGFTHVFLMEFENEEQRDYYQTKDPVHKEFIKTVMPMVKNGLGVDFVAGVF